MPPPMCGNWSAHPGAREAMVGRVVHLGFEVRAELILADGAAIVAQVTRAEAEQLELHSGDIVWVATDRRRAGEPVRV